MSEESPNVTQNRAKMAERGPQEARKWAQDGPKLGPRWAPNGFKIGLQSSWKIEAKKGPPPAKDSVDFGALLEALSGLLRSS